MPHHFRLALIGLLFLGNGALPFSIWAHGDLHERILALSVQLATQTTNADLWLQRADLHRQHGAWSAAQADLNEASRLKPGWPITLPQARLAFDCQNFPLAVRAATECLAQAPMNIDAHILRARSWVQLHAPARALADYDAVLNQTNTARPLPDLFLERAEAQASLGKFSDAVRGLDDAMRQFGVTPSFALPAIEYERKGDRVTNALQRLAQVERFFDRDSWFTLRGELQLQAGQFEAAATDFSAALDQLKKLSPERRTDASVLAHEARLRAGLKQATVAVAPTHP